MNFSFSNLLFIASFLTLPLKGYSNNLTDLKIHCDNDYIFNQIELKNDENYVNK